MEEIIRLISVFENCVAAQWQYDTKLDYSDSYITSAQEKKCDSLTAATRQAKQQLIDAITNMRENREND